MEESSLSLFVNVTVPSSVYLPTLTCTTPEKPSLILNTSLKSLTDTGFRTPVHWPRSGNANTKSVLLPLGVLSSGVSWRKVVPCVKPPAPIAMY